MTCHPIFLKTVIVVGINSGSIAALRKTARHVFLSLLQLVDANV